MDREHQERITRLKAEQEQQREAATQEAVRRRLAQKTVRHHTPDNRIPQNYSRLVEDAEQQAKQDVAGREARDLSYLEQQHDKQRGQRIAVFERENVRGERRLEKARQNVPDIAQKRVQGRDMDRER